MKILKKITSLLAIAAMLGTVVASLFAAGSAQAFDAGDLFSTVDGGQSFTEFTPGEDLTLSDEGLNSALTTTDDAKTFIMRIVNFALGFLGLLAVLIVIYGGVLYVTAAGAEEKTETGKKAITYATIGLLIVMGSFAFVNTVIRGAGGDGNSTSQYVVGANTGGSFNASAAEVRNIARDIYTNFIFFAEVNEELKGLLNDIDRSSLDYKQTLVKKSDMLGYLYSLKEKLINIRSKVVKFTETYGKINELLAYVESSIDQINSKTKTKLTRISGNGGLEHCSTEYDSNFYDKSNNDHVLEDAGEAIIEGIASPFETFVCSSSYTNYQYELHPIWAETEGGIQKLLKEENTSSKKSINYILPPVRDDFKLKVLESLSELHEVRQSLSGLDVVESGSIGSIYNKMIAEYGYEPLNPSTSTSGFLRTIAEWGIIKGPSDVNSAGNSLVNALKLQLKFADELEALQSVTARLQANITTGNAPLVVTFDTLNSLDPAGGSITASSITWDLKGLSGLEGLDADAITTAVECIQPETDQDLYGPAFNQCTYKYPGTYIATVTIESNDPSKYVSGRSSLIIKVSPPTTRIELTVKAGSKEMPIIGYYDNGILKIDRDYIPVTLNEAKDGLIFDATDTQNVSNFKWSFGDSDIVDGSGDSFGEQEKSFKDQGKYKIELEVMNKLGEVDRKIFTLDVRDVAARIEVTPSEDIFVNSSVLIDGSLSSSSSGSIRSYEWAITDATSGEDQSLGANANKSSFTHEFKEPGKYKVKLKVTSELESVDADPYIIVVESQPPVAVLNYEMPSESQPSVVYLNGSESFDPDGKNTELDYEWKIEPADPASWIPVNNSLLTQESPIIKFRKKGTYTVTLKVTDSSTTSGNISPEYSEVIDEIVIDDILDIAWSEDQVVTGILGGGNNKEGEATINFNLESDNAVAYEINFGDSDISTGEIKNSKTIPHVYKSAGKFDVEVTVYDEDDNDKTIRRKVFIGGGDVPIAKAGVFVNGVEISDLSEPIEVSKKDILTFDATDSKNTDGTGRNLKYSWNFGDTNRSSNKSATHSYKELSPQDPGYFSVKLQVYDKESPEKSGEDELRIKVVNKLPKFASIQAVPDAQSSDLITPVSVDMKAFEAEDPDGEIVQYKWWYYDLNDPDEPLGIQVTKSPVTKLTIGTSGKEGRKVTYGFGVEVTDSDNQKVSSEETLRPSQIPNVTVTNGPNELPTAKFNVDTTSIFTGDKVSFTSASKDPDGKLISYIWDVEGDGFFNNEPTKKSTIEHEYKEKNLNGYDVRLKVIDDKGGESISESISIYVDSLADAPKAAFKFDVVEGSAGKKIKFINTSTADESAGAKIISNKWDFDIESPLPTADSDGDGFTDNDIDSQAKDPERLYTSLGLYKIKLTVTDNQGNVDEVIRSITIPLADPPAASFTYQVTNGQVIFNNTSGSDIAQGNLIDRYVWDFDTNSSLDTADTSGDGVKDNDVDSELANPVHTYSTSGQYQVKLTVVDSQGAMDEITNTVNFTTTGQTGDVAGETSLKALMTTNPIPANDGVLYLTGAKGSVTFDFSTSEGAIAYYIIDKNVHFDTDGDGVKDNDQDFKTTLPGTWKTNFEKAWGETVVKLTVVDIYDNKSTLTKEVKFK